MNMFFAWLWLVAAMQAPPVSKAVVETSAGTFVIDLAADAAPNQTAYFMKLASEHAYDGTTFHRMVKCRSAFSANCSGESFNRPRSRLASIS